MANTRALYDLKQEDLDSVSAGQISHHIAIVVRSYDQTIIQTGGSQLDVITNNNPIIVAKQIGKP
jgi:hypothetical protein